MATDYEKKYKEALERAKRLTSDMTTLQKIREFIFPELAESEDERIRKKMIEHFKSKTKDTWCNMPVKSILAWLEKQKDSASNNFDDVWNEEDCEEIIAEGQKLTPRFKELLKEVCHAWYDRGAKLEKQKEQKPAEWSDTNELVFKDICNHLEVEGYSGWVVLLNALRNGEFQSKQEWSEEDEEILKLLILNIGRYMYFGGMSSERILSFLKSLRPQQRQEWSEEEKEILDSILSHYVLIDKPIDANGIPKEKYISLIKSIRFDTYKNCNSHWKPSEEQMDALERASTNKYLSAEQFDILVSLYEQLKKL